MANFNLCIFVWIQQFLIYGQSNCAIMNNVTKSLLCTSERSKHQNNFLCLLFKEKYQWPTVHTYAIQNRANTGLCVANTEMSITLTGLCST